MKDIPNLEIIDFGKDKLVLGGPGTEGQQHGTIVALGVDSYNGDVGLVYLTRNDLVRVQKWISDVLGGGA